MHVLAVQTAVPVAEEAAVAHALLVREVIERRGAVRLAGFFDVDDGLAGRDRRRAVGRAHLRDVGLFEGVLTREEDAVVGAFGAIRKGGCCSCCREGEREDVGVLPHGRVCLCAHDKKG